MKLLRSLAQCSQNKTNLILIYFWVAISGSLSQDWLNSSNNWSASWKMISYSRPKLSDLYTLSQSKLFENHTLHSGTYLYSPYMVVPPALVVCLKGFRTKVFVSNLRAKEQRFFLDKKSQRAKAGRKAEIGNVLSLSHFLFVYLFAYEV